MRLIHFVSFLMVGLMVAPAVAPAIQPVLAQDTLPRVESASCWMALPDGVVEGDNIECGYLIVPEDRSRCLQPNDSTGLRDFTRPRRYRAARPGYLSGRRSRWQRGR